MDSLTKMIKDLQDMMDDIQNDINEMAEWMEEEDGPTEAENND